MNANHPWLKLTGIAVIGLIGLFLMLILIP